MTVEQVSDLNNHDGSQSRSTAANSLNAQSKNPFRDDSSREHAGRFGMWLLLLSLAMLFAASLVGFLVIRLQLADVWPTGLVKLPPALWISTVLLLISSGTMHLAMLAAKRGRRHLLTLMLFATFALGCGFLASQVHCWVVALQQLQTLWINSEAYRYAVMSFYVFSGVHGLHVIGGLLPMSIVTARAAQGKYTRDRHAGVYYTSMYWHFLDGVWIVLFTSLLIGI